MAEDLDMYQADISNLEKAKKSSDITDKSTHGNVQWYQMRLTF